MDSVNELCDLLQSHANRDKVVSLASYVLKLWGSTANRKDLLTASGRLATARATLRIFDDAATLKNAIAYGFGEKDGPFWGALGVVNNSFSLAYYQAEKLVFLMDSGVVKLDPQLDSRVRTAHKLFWALGSFVGFIRSLKALHGAALVLKDPEGPKCADARYKQASLTSTKFLLDVVHSVSWLPEGWLWGSRLSVPHQSGVATASAVLALVLHYNGKRLAAAR